VKKLRSPVISRKRESSPFAKCRQQHPASAFSEEAGSTFAGTTDDFLRWLEEGLSAMCRGLGSLPAGLLDHW
jgi:hypothetical protein